MMIIKTLREHFQDYLERLSSLNYSPRTLKCIRTTVTEALKWFDTYAITSPDNLNRGCLEHWQKQVFSHITRAGLPLKAVSINKKVCCLQGFLLYMEERGYAMKGLSKYILRVKEPKMLPTSILSDEQMRKLLENITTTTSIGYMDRAIMELLYTAGLRSDELLGIDVEHLNLNDKTVLVTGKGRKQRIVPIGKTAMRYIESYVKAVRPFLLKDASETALFLKKNGERYQYHNLRRMIQRYALKQDFDVRVSPHTFRRSTCTELIKGGAGLYHVKELMGHESLNTLKNYTKLTILDLKKTHKRCHPRERQA